MARDGISKVPLRGTLLPRFLKDLRTDCSLKALYIAEKLEIAPSSYSDYEKGNVGKIPVKSLEIILTVFYKELCELGNVDKNKEDFDSFVCRLLKERFLDVLEPQILRNQFWIFVLFFKHNYVTEVSVLGNKQYMYGLLQELYKGNSWEYFFSKLNDTKFLKKSDCQTAGEVYIYPPENSNDPPIIRVRYELTEDDIKKKIEDMDKLRLKTIDIFMLVFNGYLLNRNNIQAALKKTCTKLGEWNFRLIYNLLEYYNLPKYAEHVDFSKDTALLLELTAVMDKYKITYNDIVTMFRANYLECKTRFITAIAFDFGFIKRLNSIQLKNYRKELIKTTEEYKKAIFGEESDAKQADIKQTNEKSE